MGFIANGLVLGVEIAFLRKKREERICKFAWAIVVVVQSLDKSLVH